jgi:hypothetical protein
VLGAGTVAATPEEAAASYALSPRPTPPAWTDGWDDKGGAEEGWDLSDDELLGGLREEPPLPRAAAEPKPPPAAQPKPPPDAAPQGSDSEDED